MRSRPRSFTGDIEQTFRKKIERNLGRPINPKLANLGRLLWFDRFSRWAATTAVAGAIRPRTGWATPNRSRSACRTTTLVGPHRSGPRNQRRAPTVINALCPEHDVEQPPRIGRSQSLRYLAGLQSPVFPVPEDLGTPTAPIQLSSTQNNLHGVTHLLQAQAHLPPTELTELAGFREAAPTASPTRGWGAASASSMTTTAPGQPLPLPIRAASATSRFDRRCSLR